MSTFRNFMSGLEILGQYIDPDDTNAVSGSGDFAEIYVHLDGPTPAEQEQLRALGWKTNAETLGKEPEENGTGIWVFWN